MLAERSQSTRLKFPSTQQRCQGESVAADRSGFVSRNTKQGQESFNSVEMRHVGKGIPWKEVRLRKPTGSVGGVYSSSGKNPRGFTGDEKIGVSSLPPLPLAGKSAQCSRSTGSFLASPGAVTRLRACPGSSRPVQGAATRSWEQKKTTQNTLKHPEC